MWFELADGFIRQSRGESSIPSRGYLMTTLCACYVEFIGLKGLRPLHPDFESASLSRSALRALKIKFKFYNIQKNSTDESRGLMSEFELHNDRRLLRQDGFVNHSSSARCDVTASFTRSLKHGAAARHTPAPRPSCHSPTSVCMLQPTPDFALQRKTQTPP
jgi:hypothetical protein